jgi:hypothetical protein
MLMRERKPFKRFQADDSQMMTGLKPRCECSQSWDTSDHLSLITYNHLSLITYHSSLITHHLF